MFSLVITAAFILAALQEMPTDSKPTTPSHAPTTTDSSRKEDEALILGLRFAVKMSDRQRDPIGWASAQLLLGTALKAKNELPEAETVMRSGLEEIARAHREDEPGFLEFRREYASLLVDAGKLKDAEIVYKALLPAANRVLGEKNRKTLAIRSDYAFFLIALERFADAETETRSILTDGVPVLGTEDHDMVEARTQLANALAHQGKNAEAEADYRAVIPLMEHTLGPFDGRVLLARYNLAFCLRGQKKFEDALDLARQVEKTAQQKLPKDDPLQKDFEKLRKDLEKSLGKAVGE